MIEPALKVNYEQEIDQQYCESDPDSQSEVRRVHALDLTPNCQRGTARQMRLHLMSDRSQISVLGIRVHDEDTLHIVVAHHHRRCGMVNGSDITQELRLSAV